MYPMPLLQPSIVQKTSLNLGRSIRSETEMNRMTGSQNEAPLAAQVAELKLFAHRLLLLSIGLCPPSEGRLMHARILQLKFYLPFERQLIFFRRLL